jgi:ribosomal protein S2
VWLPGGLTNFRSTSVKPYFRSKNTYTVKLDKLEAPAKLDKLEAPTKLDKLKASLPTLEVPRKLTKPTKPTIKRSQGRP